MPIAIIYWAFIALLVLLKLTGHVSISWWVVSMLGAAPFALGMFILLALGVFTWIWTQ